MVGAARFELATPSPPDWCANRAALRSEAKRALGSRGSCRFTQPVTASKGARKGNPWDRKGHFGTRESQGKSRGKSGIPIHPFGQEIDAAALGSPVDSFGLKSRYVGI